MSDLTRRELEQLSGPVVVEFGAEWCGVCRAFAPARRRLLDLYPDFRFISVEDGPGRRLGRSFEVKLWPTLIFLNDGQVTRKVVRPSDVEAQQAFEALSTASGNQNSPATS